MKREKHAFVVPIWILVCTSIVGSSPPQGRRDLDKEMNNQTSHIIDTYYEQRMDYDIALFLSALHCIYGNITEIGMHSTVLMAWRIRVILN